MHKSLIYDVSGGASWESRGIDRPENGPWENQFRLRVASIYAFSSKICSQGAFWGSKMHIFIEKHA